ncbi:MAG: hypothetical protein GWN18_16075, partial [Thermoplasmata archaeon]|nr:hypothetical protein [Thermoplasmata archaeon]NIS13589.1 hypothetical protein [Thermoplasmata archaeon]NIS21458.1 hypothetical protein [Thermoplasmata archaeon]NIT79022.1 hypothetical protein [Thermoplasmata archaeon]NIU50510.1 hypothetical protein [Thermoplasmata archaeon]
MVSLPLPVELKVPVEVLALVGVALGVLPQGGGEVRGGVRGVHEAEVEQLRFDGGLGLRLDDRHVLVPVPIQGVALWDHQPLVGQVVVKYPGRIHAEDVDGEAVELVVLDQLRLRDDV